MVVKKVKNKTREGGINMIWEMLYCTLFFIVPIVGMLTIISVESLKCKNAIDIDELEVVEREEKAVNGARYVNVITSVEKLITNYYGKMRPCDQNAQGIVIDLNDYRKEKKQKGKAYSRDGPYNTS